MEIVRSLDAAASIACDALIVPVAAGDADLAASLPAALPQALREAVASLARDAAFTARPGSALVAPTLGQAPAARIVLAGIGAADAPAAADRIARGFGAAARAARDAGARSVALSLDGAAAAHAASAVAGVEMGCYEYRTFHGTGRKNGDAAKRIGRVAVAGAAVPDGAVERGRAVASAVNYARDLVNEPAASLTPEAFAGRAREVATASGLDIEVLDVAALEAAGANAIIGVGKGSAHPPCMIRMRYRPATARDGRVVGLVGKCITFDTGGYSIKTHDGMLEMKGDMAGGAAVLAVMTVLGKLGCPVAVDATICAAENMISGTAFRPSDILTAMNGITIEIISTDAEGRLVLADGLVDAARRGATELIDLATLTGAIIVALGDGATGLFSSSDPLADNLLAASGGVGERMWRMPLFEELEDKIKGDVGDIRNSGGRYGGAITAALFLQRFREGLPWAHLDIAGSARFERANALGPKGGSGVGVRTLLSYLLGEAV
ncbi:MAG: leucyl aminopeptidase [Chloroflexota bacterium]